MTVALVGTSVFTYHHYSQKDVAEIVLTQFAPHPSLDKIRQGFLDTLKKKAPKIKVDFQNAQGSIPLTLQIAQKFVSQSPKMIVAITTPSAMSGYQAAKGAQIPVIFSAVTYPKEAKLAQDNPPLLGITGVSDNLDPKLQVDFLKTITFKKPINKIAVIYTAGETNAVAQTEAFENTFKNAGYTVNKIAIQNTCDIALAAQKACENNDLIYLQNDNTVISAIPQILKISAEFSVPVITSDPESVELGALAALAYDQYAIGEKTAEVALKILGGAKAEAIPVSYPNAPSVYTNKTVLQKFGVVISQKNP